ncbi:MAG: YgiQ family radical SAM protein [Bacteroidales bacterium]|nr:YgiQ family radical SAM protein [Bacteroidales bacterium]
MKKWLPITAKEAERNGWSEIDVILISGDAYVDHPSFGTAIIGRWIEYLGYKVAIIPQPNWQDDLRDFKKFGVPRLFFGVSAGNMDSMVNHYTAFKRLRSDDAYTPGGKAGFRPDYACVAYSKILKSLYPDVPVIIGGVEASMRRLTHYDYWSDTVKPSILIESNADMLVYGMGEKAIQKIIEELEKGNPISQIDSIPQTAFVKDSIPADKYSDYKILPSHEECLKSKTNYATAFTVFEEESHKMHPKGLIQKYEDKYVIVNPSEPETEAYSIDKYYNLPFTRLPHPKYLKRGSIPAWEMIKHSVNIHRGCFGGCSFCAISAHQGKYIQNRSEKSILKELDAISQMEDFKGHITDLGGPSANMYKMQGKNLDICQKCKRASCLFPSVCANLSTNHSDLINLYEKSANVKGIKKITIGSGIRYDLFLNRPKSENKVNNHDMYLEVILTRHISGRFKVAPEHTQKAVLDRMRKPGIELYENLQSHFGQISHAHHINIQLIPYLISNHPGSDFEDMIEMAIWLKKNNIKPEQVQDFTPTPMTYSTTMYYCGFDPYTKEKITVQKDVEKRKEQQILFFYYKRENRKQITSVLHKYNKMQIGKRLLD